MQGVVLQDGSEVRSKVVLSNAAPQTTFLKLTPQVSLGGELRCLPSPARMAQWWKVDL